MSAFETLIYEKRGQMAYVTLNRPEVMNIHNIQMRDDMYEVLSAVKLDEEVRAILFKGAGEKAFCAGADLTEFLTAPPPTAAREVRFDKDLWGLFLSLHQPLIAAAHGYVLGSGIEIVLCCDLIIASEDARFGLPEVGLGIIPAAGATQTVPRAVGRGKALEMLLTNRWIGAEEALQAGLVTKVVPRDHLLPTAEAMASKIAGQDPLLMRSAKQLVSRGLDLTLAEGLELEKKLAVRLTPV
ncbi:MAG: enoyl-CoA hydratase/isomerase family protein [Deltaproteobacteria bacterium]|nr:enoyl-CoA hydratase/isomerase family protein [Deltaproteobacteria bacterium]MBW2053044.1 enoyl-CoA hydratase/isomerase family protein [Deltaproteobacteria bacterium]MBW2141263.1 enoyl-CoA hydratase/isomerase family protein [Deltaproteobacteria bacterium]MBW2322833.1 enoyl-CoA hydratase/isomerase family protein [Deltaproteobacteria bacterium]